MHSLRQNKYILAKNALKQQQVVRYILGINLKSHKNSDKN